MQSVALRRFQVQNVLHRVHRVGATAGITYYAFTCLMRCKEIVGIAFWHAQRMSHLISQSSDPVFSFAPLSFHLFD
jgi:hypothetical protein